MKHKLAFLRLFRSFVGRSGNRNAVRTVCLALFLSISFSAYSQITISFKEQPLRSALKQIEQVSAYKFFYNESLPDLDRKVSLNVQDATIDQTMRQLLAKTALSYKQEQGNVIALIRKPAQNASSAKKITGIVVDANGEPIIGATVMVKGASNIMKIKMNIKRMVVGLMTVSICCGCADLSEDLTGQPTSDKFFKTIVDFNSYISGAYTPLVKLYGEDAPYVACAGAEDVCTPVVRWKGFEQVNINTVGNPEEVTDILWNNCYSSISACNTTIELVAQNTNLTAEELSPIDGEAKFLRAFGYFQLVRWFGEVPLLTEANQKNASVEPQAAIADIYKQIVVDLQSAETTLPSKREDRTRPTSWTAKSLLAKVYLTMAGFPLNDTSCYALARDKAGEVINEKVYSLERHFFDLWLYDNRQTNSEFIFTLYGNSISRTGGYQFRATRPDANGEGGWADWTSDSRFFDMFPKGDGSRVKGTFYLTMIDGTPWE